MQTQTLLRRPAVGPTKSTMLSHIPVRVFLLSDGKLLRQAFVRVFNADRRIWFAGAREFSDATTAEITEPACEVLLMDPVNISTFNTKILDQLRGSLFSVQIVTLEREAGMAMFYLQSSRLHTVRAVLRMKQVILAAVRIKTRNKKQNRSLNHHLTRAHRLYKYRWQ